MLDFYDAAVAIAADRAIRMVREAGRGGISGSVGLGWREKQAEPQRALLPISSWETTPADMVGFVRADVILPSMPMDVYHTRISEASRDLPILGREEGYAGEPGWAIFASSETDDEDFGGWWTPDGWGPFAGREVFTSVDGHRLPKCRNLDAIWVKCGEFSWLD